MSFEIVKKFENDIAAFFGAPFAVAVDCCTHGIELCLRYKSIEKITVPTRTYLSIPFLTKQNKLLPPNHRHTLLLFWVFLYPKL